MQFEKLDSGQTVAKGALFHYEIVHKGKKFQLTIDKVGESSEKLDFQDFGGAKLYAIEHDKREVKELAKRYGYQDCVLTQISEWGKSARPNPIPRDKAIQLGCVFEEIGELTDAVGQKSLGVALQRTGLLFKQFRETLNIKNPVLVLDACLDIIVTLIILMDLLGYDWRGGLAEVARSNYSKFERGEPVFDENGKIKKGKYYTPPELEPFIPIVGANNA